jgi:hypothetical protein
MRVDPASDGNEAVVTFPRLSRGILPDGRYRLTVLAGGVFDLSGNTMSADATFDFHVLTGDADGDGTVGFGDLVVLAQHYGRPGVELSFSRGDFDYDGDVDFADLVLLSQNYGRTLPPPAAAASLQQGVGARNVSVLTAMAARTTPKTRPVSRARPGR